MFNLNIVILALCSMAPLVSGQEIGLFYSRKDNLNGQTKVQVLPIALYSGGKFTGFKSLPSDDTGLCPKSSFVGKLKPGTSYRVISGGKNVGSVVTGSEQIADFSCSTLCTLEVKGKLQELSTENTYQRGGFTANESFDETITQAVVVTASHEEFSSPVATPPAFAKGAISKWVELKMPWKGAPAKKLKIETLRPFHSNNQGEWLYFVVANISDDKNDYLRRLSAIVKIDQKRLVTTVFELVAEGDPDRGVATFEFLEPISLQKDSPPAVVAIFHNYEFHEIQILKFDGKRYVVVHKGPKYGC